jgi:hypothetical protein
MKKNILSLIILATVAVMATAQTAPMTMRAFTAGGATMDNNSYGVFGQPIGDIVAQNGYEVSAGVAQMQLVRDTTYVVMTQGDNYVDERGYVFPNVQNPVQKSLKDSLYLVNGGIYRYDLVEYLYIWICDTMKDKAEPSILYPSVAIDGYCWTRENLRTNLGTPMTYTSDQYPNVDVEKYGYLYTLEDAKTLCPDGWYLPDETAMNLLKGHDATTILRIGALVADDELPVLLLVRVDKIKGVNEVSVDANLCTIVQRQDTNIVFVTSRRSG